MCMHPNQNAHRVFFKIHQENRHQEVFQEITLAKNYGVLLVPKAQISEPVQDFLKWAYLFFQLLTKFHL